MSSGYYPLMVLVAVDDLLFSSKIRTTAKQAGVEITFARTPQEILDQARALKPALAIFDLNSAKADPVTTIAALKRDPALASIRTLGFVSHVHTELIDAARAELAKLGLPTPLLDIPTKPAPDNAQAEKVA